MQTAQKLLFRRKSRVERSLEAILPCQIEVNSSGRITSEREPNGNPNFHESRNFGENP
jgi:hypothetical protein